MVKLNRRVLNKSLVVGGASLLLSRTGSAAAQSSPASAVTANAIRIADFEALDREFSTQAFTFADTKCLLVRLPTPAGTIEKTERILETTRTTGSGQAQTVYLTAFTRVCTHLGCTPALPDIEHRMVCPCHGSVYALDGSVIQGPATRALQAVQIEVREGAVIATALLDEK